MTNCFKLHWRNKILLESFLPCCSLARVICKVLLQMRCSDPSCQLWQQHQPQLRRQQHQQLRQMKSEFTSEWSNGDDHRWQNLNCHRLGSVTRRRDRVVRQPDFELGARRVRVWLPNFYKTSGGTIRVKLVPKKSPDLWVFYRCCCCDGLLFCYASSDLSKYLITSIYYEIIIL